MTLTRPHFAKLVLLALCCLPAVAAGQVSVRETYNDQAFKLLQSGNLSEAERLYRAAIREAETARLEDVTYANSLRGLSIVRRAQGVIDEAEAIAVKALALSDRVQPNTWNHAAAMGTLGDALTSKAKYTEAIAIYQRQLRLVESKPDLVGLLPFALQDLSAAYVALARYAEADPFATRALAAADAAADRTPQSVSAYQLALSTVRWRQGRLPEAEALARAALTAREKALGADDASTASAGFQLAAVLNGAGRSTEAEALYTRTLATYETVYGPDAPQLPATLNNLALIYSASGRYDLAEATHRRSLAIRERVYGPDHPQVAGTLSNIASVLLSKDDLAGAAALYRRALAIRQKTFGLDSTQAADTERSLAGIASTRGQYKAAETQYRRVLTILEKAYGVDSTQTAGVISDIGDSVANQEQYPAAEAFYRRGLAIQQKTFGVESVQAASFLSSLGWVQGQQGEYAQAESTYRRVLAIQEAAYGADAPAVLNTVGAIAGQLYNRGDRQTSEAMYRRALTAQIKQTGSDSAAAAGIRLALVSFAEDRGEFSAALAERRKILAIRERVFGLQGSSIADSLSGIGDNLLAIGDLTGAQVPYRRAFDIQAKLMPADSLRVTGAEAKLAWLMMETGNYAAAEPILLRAAASAEKLYGPSHRYVAGPLRSVAASLCAQGRTSECKSLLQRAETIAAAQKRNGVLTAAAESASLGDRLSTARRFSEARAAYHDALGVIVEALGSQHARVRAMLEQIAVTYDREGKAPLAAFYRTRASLVAAAPAR